MRVIKNEVAGEREHAAALPRAALLTSPRSCRDSRAALGFVGFRLEEGGDGYVSSLYVSPRAQGGGVGRLLLAEAEKRLRESGSRTARLWVFEGNAPSRAFYVRQGWRPDGRRETLPEWGQPQVGMIKDLGG